MTSGATIIIYCNDPVKRDTFLLTGKESKYVTDLSKHSEFNQFMGLIGEKEEFIGDNLEEAKSFFSKEARDLEKGEVGLYIERQKLGNRRIHYDTPIRTTTGFHVKYRFLPRDFKRGVIKGGKEEGETSEDAILREVREEVGMNIPKKEFKLIGNCSDNDVFSLHIDIRNIKMFQQAISGRYEKRSGEVFDLQFKPLFQIESDISEYNTKSRCAIKLFKSQMHTSVAASAASAASAAATDAAATDAAATSAAATSVAATSVAASAAEEKSTLGKGKNKKNRKGRVKKVSKKGKVRSKKGKVRSRKIKYI